MHDCGVGVYQKGSESSHWFDLFNVHFFSDDLSPAQNGRKHRLAPPSTLPSLWVHASFLLLGMGTATSADLTPWRVEFQIQVGENSNFRGPWTGIWGHFRKLKFEFKSQMYLPWILRLGS